MGYNTTIVIMNDALDQIEKDPKFGEKLAMAIREASSRPHARPVAVAAGHHVNAALVIESHHADHTSLVAVGGNFASTLFTGGTYSHHLEDGKALLLRDAYNASRAGKAKASQASREKSIFPSAGQ